MSKSKQVTVRHESSLRFLATTGSGFEIALDNAAGATGPRPTEVLLAALGGCTAMDVASILAKKRQVVASYEVRVSGVQRETHPDVFTEITILHVVEGDAVEPEAVRRAIELSATRYCTVSAQLSSGVARLRHTYLVRRPGASGQSLEVQGEVVVTGPLAAIEEEAAAPTPSADAGPASGSGGPAQAAESAAPSDGSATLAPASAERRT